jgi:(p)ppGpp synthase/HD superfamily hydrolase
MSTLERAVAIAAEAHAGQVDKAGAPYLLHPLRVMLQMRTQEERIVAVLHDVVEDSEFWMLDRLRAEGFPPSIVEAIHALTRRLGETYDDFIGRAGRHPMARRVKVADLHDNMDLSRIACPTDNDRQRVAKYGRAMEKLKSQASEESKLSGAGTLPSPAPCSELRPPMSTSVGQ